MDAEDLLAGEAALVVVVMTAVVTRLEAAATVAGTEVEAEGILPIRIEKGRTPVKKCSRFCFCREILNDFLRGFGGFCSSSTVN